MSEIDNGYRDDSRPMRRFYLNRVKDETGISRTGRVLEGVLTQSGMVFVQWRPPMSTMGIYNTMDEFLNIHVRCHPSCNEVVWLDKDERETHAYTREMAEFMGVRYDPLTDPPTDADFVYAADARCVCGAGLAHFTTSDPTSQEPGRWSWACAAALKKELPDPDPHMGKHKDLPFATWEVKSENQPSAGGRTTRPKAEEITR